MDGALLQQKVYYGYAQSALRVGLPYSLFRPSSANNPMAGSPLLTLKAAFSPSNYTFNKPQVYSKATWQGLFDGRITQVFDILIGQKTYFIAAMQAVLPILVVEAPRTVNVNRPFRTSGTGFQPEYGGISPAIETPLMEQWPASILKGARGENTGVGSPDDMRAPWWDILMPSFSGINLLTSDIIVDDLGRRFTIDAAEITPMGWRFTALQAQA